jgi:hypothetical protein
MRCDGRKWELIDLFSCTDGVQFNSSFRHSEFQVHGAGATRSFYFVWAGNLQAQIPQVQIAKSPSLHSPSSRAPHLSRSPAAASLPCAAASLDAGKRCSLHRFVFLTYFVSHGADLVRSGGEDGVDDAGGRAGQPQLLRWRRAELGPRAGDPPVTAPVAPASSSVQRRGAPTSSFSIDWHRQQRRRVPSQLSKG